jgi:hypothetical protein
MLRNMLIASSVAHQTTAIGAIPKRYHSQLSKVPLPIRCAARDRLRQYSRQCVLFLANSRRISRNSN